MLPGNTQRAVRAELCVLTYLIKRHHVLGGDWMVIYHCSLQDESEARAAQEAVQDRRAWMW